MSRKNDMTQNEFIEKFEKLLFEEGIEYTVQSDWEFSGPYFTIRDNGHTHYGVVHIVHYGPYDGRTLVTLPHGLQVPSPCYRALMLLSKLGLDNS